ncbi:protein of unknown function (plasmid) [Rhodovastum atsumiense]|uniref:PAS domain-containing protein n=1 Tax=Rhodovastum atsumiense TaxID=504468 RepID=UPI0020248D35|nr:PAS domain-containing protein [Rhodovastum atsumiense]CAH2605599.1 protein of unknown function [Rhodovastum atsumiense]
MGATPSEHPRGQTCRPSAPRVPATAWLGVGCLLLFTLGLIAGVFGTLGSTRPGNGHRDSNFATSDAELSRLVTTTAARLLADLRQEATIRHALSLPHGTAGFSRQEEGGGWPPLARLPARLSDQPMAAVIAEAGDGGLAEAASHAAGAVITDAQAILRSDDIRQENTPSQRILPFTVLALAATSGALLLGGVLVLRLRATSVTRAEALDVAELQWLLGSLDQACVMVRDCDDIIRFWSDGCQRVYGWTAAQAVGRSAQDLLQTIFPVPEDELRETLLREGEWRGDLRQRTRDGAEVTVAAHLAVRLDDSGEVVAILEDTTDVTALREAEAALSEGTERLRTVMNAVNEAVVVATADGCIASVNPTALRLFGYTRAEDLLGRDADLLVPPACTARGLRGRRRDGSEFPIELSLVNGNDGGHTALIRDASSSGQAALALREAELRLRLARQLGEIADFEWTISDSMAIAGPDWCRLYRLPPGRERLSWQDWVALLHPEDRKRVIGEMRVLVARGGAITTRFRIHGGDGAVRQIRLHVESVRAADGTTLRLIGAQQEVIADTPPTRAVQRSAA